MGKSNDLNIYFPLNNLNPQGWISEFITPMVVKTGNNRSDLANLLYDKVLTQAVLDRLKNDGKLSQQEINKYYELRLDNLEDKMTYLNGNHLDILEIDETLKDSTLDDADLREYTSFMAQIKPHQAAFLQSYIKLEYGYRENINEEFKYINFPFSQYFNLDFILSNKTQARSEGSGISSVTVNNKFNLATQVNSEIDINFIFGNMKMLTQEILENGSPLGKGLKSPYPFGFSFMKLVSNMDSNKEIIRLEYGRKVDPAINQYVTNKKIKTIIENKEKKSLLLSKYSHSFNFDEKGVVNIGVKFYNYHDVQMLAANNIAIPAPSNLQKLKLSKEFGNILKSFNDLKNIITVLESQLQDAKSLSEASTVDKISSSQKDAAVKDITQKLAKTNKTFNLLKRSLKPNLTTIFLDKIKSQGQLFGVNFNTIKVKNTFDVTTNIFLVSPDNGDFKNIITYNKNYDVDKIKSKIVDKSTNTDLITRILARVFNSPYDELQQETKKTYGQIMFFPLKALITAGYSFLDLEERKTIPHMLFGNTLMKVGNKTCSVNIGDLLIETGVFQKWYYSKFYKKDKLEYSFGTFITDIINDLVPEALYRNRVGFDDKSPTTAVKQTQYYLKEDISLQLKHNLYIRNDRENLVSLSHLLTKNPTANPKPVIYYGQLNNMSSQITSPVFSNLGISEFKFDEIQDSAKGIPHIKIGADGGIFTSVKFNASDFSKIRSALALEALASNSSRYFFFYYQLNIDMIGNNTLAYDSIVCVPSNPLGIDSEINDPGIAGYYKVISTTDTLDANNNYNTSATADWVFNPKYNNREKQKSAAAPVADIKIRDYIDSGVNEPVNHVIELLENDANAIINSRLQKIVKVIKKKDEAKKNKTQKVQKVLTRVEKNETLGQSPLPGVK